MGDMTKHFSRSEFACKCGCGSRLVWLELLQALEKIREWAGAPVSIVSGVRCKKHNAAVNGAIRSRHLTGEAADIRVAGKTPEEVVEFCIKNWPDKYGVGYYPVSGFVHIDIRTSRARWEQVR